jgi:hypothetical protein
LRLARLFFSASGVNTTASISALKFSHAAPITEAPGGKRDPPVEKTDQQELPLRHDAGAIVIQASNHR